ncbi:hypothetical protein ACFVUR_19405, partial [Stenotrophomonas bentonitica]
ADRSRPHVVTLWRRADGKWGWTRQGGNRVIIGGSHRVWTKRLEAERNLQAVNAQPYRLEVHESHE